MTCEAGEPQSPGRWLDGPPLRGRAGCPRWLLLLNPRDLHVGTSERTFFSGRLLPTARRRSYGPPAVQSSIVAASRLKAAAVPTTQRVTPSAPTI